MRRGWALFSIGLALLAGPACVQAQDNEIVPAPTAAQWAAIADLPDFSGTWLPDIGDQKRQEQGPDSPPWKPDVQKQVDHWFAEEDAGRPRGLLVDCLPHGMPSLMLITHNAIEFLVTPGRVTVLGEVDGNRLRRIHTDGRSMPEDPDPSFDGYSVGHWEGDALMVETTAILPQTYLAVSEAVGIPSNGGMTVSERIHLIAPDTMAVDMEITAPELLTRPWKTRRIYNRSRDRIDEIQEGVCRQGDFHEDTDEYGNAIYVPTTSSDDGNLLPPGS
ncbi:hypothetical protein GRI89_00425 [Altererythrobacter salegens]|uniref:Uncharacterized protein n=1 Tax=Croceibacterium salegens TaxID=1737568 RepID=A0A6I4SSJ1_9SPHN|nr:hypothetical protein [Croceibacterium salegens]MXO58010.1 hypothetical protein [Croceibacterium salegens]